MPANLQDQTNAGIKKLREVTTDSGTLLIRAKDGTEKVRSYQNARYSKNV